MHAVTLGKGPEWLQAQGAALPLGRFVTEEECARLAVFLLSPVSAPMSGACIDLEQKVTGALP
jgi:NAD(P)-dependent dehydrogenase (short-subunit alcohol dehydrogenase family)